jgi:putative flippase GtrA
MTQLGRIGRQLISYIAAGGIAFMADFAVLVLAVQLLHLHYLIGATLGFLFGSIVCYTLSLRWAFDEHSYGSRTLEIALFVAIGVVGVALNNFVMWGLVEHGHVNYAAAKVVAAAFVLVFNFMARRTILFSGSKGRAAAVRGTPLGLATHIPAIARW